MSRDYKPRPNVPKRKAKGGTLVGIFVGLVIGVLIALGVVLYLNKAPLPFLSKGANQAEKNGEAKVAGLGQAKPGVPLLLPGKPGDKAPERAAEKPRFEFYKILPGDGEAAPGPTPKAEQPAAAAGGGEALLLQAGAFQNAADADNLKAKIALMGLEASVQQAAMQDKGVWYRVRLGPYRSQDEMGKVRNQLQQNGIQASVIKLKEGAVN